MRRDKIDQADVENCSQNPDFKRSQEEGKIEAWKNSREGYLKIVYKVEEENHIIITVTLKKKRPVWAAN